MSRRANPRRTRKSPQQPRTTARQATPRAGATPTGAAPTLAPMSARKKAVLARAAQYVCPGRVREWHDFGIDLVIGKREGYFIWDCDGHRLIDLHLNGGNFNLGHRNPEVIAALKEALKYYDIGNHHFPSIARAELGEFLAKHTPGDIQYAIYGSGGGEAGDIAIKSARWATTRRKVVSIIKGYHGHTGLSLMAGDARFSKLFHSEDRYGEFHQVPFNELGPMEEALKGRDVACVILETIPATYGFPMPKPGYLEGVRDLCTKYGTVYIADEVQTGLARTGHLWGVESYGVVPDIIVTAKGFGGGIYPITAALCRPWVAGWLNVDGWGHVSTFGGSELGCVVAKKTVEISARKSTLNNVKMLSEHFAKGLADIQSRYPFLVEVRRRGVVMGLKFDHPQGAQHVMRCLYPHGIWAIFSAYDPSALQYKVGVLVTKKLADEILERTEAGIRDAVKTLPKAKQAA